MPDPQIRLRIIVDPQNRQTITGLEKVIAPITRSVREESRKASKELEGLGAAFDKIIKRLQGYEMVKGKKSFVDLKDLLDGLAKIDRRLGDLNRKGFGQLTASFRALDTSLGGVSKRLDGILAQLSTMGRMTSGVGGTGASAGGGGAGAGGAGGGAPLTGISPAVQRRLAAALSRAKTTGAVRATFDGTDLTSLLVQSATAQGAKVTQNLGTGQTRISLPNSTERRRAAAQLASLLSAAGYTQAGNQIMSQTAAGPVNRQLWSGPAGNAYLYPDASKPSIRYFSPKPDPAVLKAQRQAERIADFNAQERANRDLLAKLGYAAHRQYQTGPMQMVEEFIKGDQIARLVTDAQRSRSRLRVPKCAGGKINWRKLSHETWRRSRSLTRNDGSGPGTASPVGAKTRSWFARSRHACSAGD